MREETGSQISVRLLEVITHADFDERSELYAFGSPAEDVTPREDEPACVHDDAWSQHLPDVRRPLGQDVRTTSKDHLTWEED